MMDLKVPIDAALAGQIWPTSSSRKMTSRNCNKGMLSTSLDVIRMSDGVTSTTLCLRYVRTSDQKVYVAQFNDDYLKNVYPIRNDPMVIEDWLGSTESAIPLSRECVITFRHFGESVTFVLQEEVDSMAEVIAQLKREHAAEIDAIRAEYKSQLPATQPVTLQWSTKSQTSLESTQFALSPKYDDWLPSEWLNNEPLSVPIVKRAKTCPESDEYNY